MSTAVAEQREARLPRTIPDFLRIPDLGKRLASIAPPGYDGARLARELAAALRENPKLQACTVDSMVVSVSRIASLGLSLAPAHGEAYLIPRKNRERENTLDATLQVGRNGWVALALRSNRNIVDMWSHALHANDLDGNGKRLSSADARPIVHSPDGGGGFRISHAPAMGDRGALVGVYAVAKLAAGGQRVCYMSRADVMAARSMADQGSLAWKNFEAMMWEKVCLKRLARQMAAGHSIITAALAADEADPGAAEIHLPEIELPPAQQPSITGSTTVADAAGAESSEHSPAVQQPSGGGTSTGPTDAEITAKINAALTGADFELCRDLARGKPELEALIDARLKDLAAQAGNKSSGPRAKS